MNKKIYARVILLTLNELPIESIEGHVISGSINVDGDSAVRRTCQLQMVTDILDVSDYLWTLNTKFKLEIGVSEDSEEIKWYKQGIYVITGFSSALSTTGYTIAISGKDKMCLLNGESSGVLNQPIDFGVEEIVKSDGSVVMRKRPLHEIIRTAILHYGQELPQNIIINDLADYGRELQEYRYDTPLYLIRKSEETIYTQATLNGDTTVYVNDSGKPLKELEYDDLSSILTSTLKPGTKFKFSTNSGIECYAARITYGQTVGYVPTELVYAGDLQAKPGESLTSVLDKIKNMLGNYEYFYDIEGRFVFQEKKNYINNAFSGLTGDVLEWVDPNVPKLQYSFDGCNLLTSFNNTPNLLNLKNDITVWGQLKSEATGKDYPICMRYAIDVKPKKYKSISVNETGEDTDDIALVKQYCSKYGFKEEEQANFYQKGQDYTSENYDWREVLYRMAADYFKYGQWLSDFEQRVANNNPEYPYGKTGYEQYYTDIFSHWRDLYDYDKKDWTDAVKNHPSSLKFWIDFLDQNGELSQFSVRAVGARPKVVNDNAVKAIYYEETPEVMFVTQTNKPTGQPTDKIYINIPDAYKGMISPSAQGKSAFTAISELLYNHSYCIESVTISSVPIYDLEPNQRISIYDPNSGINGEYLPTKFTIPLGHNSTMNITATKVVDRIL